MYMPTTRENQETCSEIYLPSVAHIRAHSISFLEQDDTFMSSDVLSEAYILRQGYMPIFVQNLFM